MEERGLVSGRGGGDRLQNKVKCVETVRFPEAPPGFAVACVFAQLPHSMWSPVSTGFSRVQQRTNRNELATTTIETTGGWDRQRAPARQPALPANRHGADALLSQTL